MADKNRSSNIPVQEIVDLVTALKSTGVMLREVSITHIIGDDLSETTTFIFDEEYDDEDPDSEVLRVPQQGGMN